MPAQSRLRTAIEDGLLTLPDGAVTLMRPPVGFDAAALGPVEIFVQQSFAPDHAAWAVAGYETSQVAHPSPVAVITMPRSKALARAMVAEAAQWARLIVVDGQKTDGIESLFKDCRKRLGALPSVTKAHGRLFWFAPSADFSDWAVGLPAKGPHGFYTTAGVYADGAVDKGSALLAEALPAKLKGRVADLGAGWGYLSQAILGHEGVTQLDLMEAEALALDCARLNVTDSRARFHWVDATQYQPDHAYDAVVMNPPFHVSRAADPGLGKAFIKAAARMLLPKGALWMVANRHLPYEETLQASFRDVTETAGNGGFKILHATRPLR